MIIAALVGAGGTARAESWAQRAEEAQGAAWLHYELSGWHDVDDTSPAVDRQGFRDLVLAGVRLHGFVGKNSTIGYHAGLDLAAGGTLRGGGFAYDVALFPVGVGVRLGATSIVAVGAGVGAMGAVGTLDDAVTVPVELTAELGGGRVRVLARARAAWVAGAPARHDGAPSLPFADELDATLALRVGHHYDEHGFPSGNGYFVGATYRELAGSRFVGAVIGYSIDLATRRRPR